MKRKLSLFLACMIAISLTACSGGTGSGSTADTSADKSESVASDKPVVLNLYTASDLESLADYQIETYTALHKNVTIEKHLIASADYDDKIKVLIAGGSDDLDVFWLRQPSQVNQYLGNNLLVDFAPYAKTSGVDLSPIKNNISGISDKDGGFYGYPTSGSCWMLFYNKKLFDAKGIKYPTDLTWDEYCDLAKQLTYEEGGTKYWGGICPNWTMNLGSAAMGEYLDSEAPLTKTMDYAKILYRMYTGDKSHMGIAEMSAGTFDINSAFGAGNIYMMINGDWEFNLLKTAKIDIEYGAAPLPVFKGADKGASVGQSSYMCVPKTSKNIQAAYDFAEYYCTSVDGSNNIAKTQNVPSYPSDKALETYKSITNVPGVDYRFTASIRNEQGPHASYNAINDAFKQEMNLYLLDEESLDDCFNNFYKLRDEIYSK